VVVAIQKTLKKHMTNNSNRAAIPNPAPDVLKTLIGEWKTVRTHPLFSIQHFTGTHPLAGLKEELSRLGTQKFMKKDFPMELEWT
jgi:hypothetical protein